MTQNGWAERDYQSFLTALAVVDMLGGPAVRELASLVSVNIEEGPSTAGQGRRLSEDLYGRIADAVRLDVRPAPPSAGAMTRFTPK